jgi:hypothetical protein
MVDEYEDFAAKAALMTAASGAQGNPAFQQPAADLRLIDKVAFKELRERLLAEYKIHCAKQTTPVAKNRGKGSFGNGSTSGSGGSSSGMATIGEAFCFLLFIYQYCLSICTSSSGGCACSSPCRGPCTGPSGARGRTSGP